MFHFLPFLTELRHQLVRANCVNLMGGGGTQDWSCDWSQCCHNKIPLTGGLSCPVLLPSMFMLSSLLFLTEFGLPCPYSLFLGEKYSWFPHLSFGGPPRSYSKLYTHLSPPAVYLPCSVSPWHHCLLTDYLIYLLGLLFLHKGRDLYILFIAEFQIPRTQPDTSWYTPVQQAGFCSSEVLSSTIHSGCLIQKRHNSFNMRDNVSWPLFHEPVSQPSIIKLPT